MVTFGDIKSQIASRQQDITRSRQTIQERRIQIETAKAEGKEILGELRKPEPRVKTRQFVERDRPGLFAQERRLKKQRLQRIEAKQRGIVSVETQLADVSKAETELDIAERQLITQETQLTQQEARISKLAQEPGIQIRETNGSFEFFKIVTTRKVIPARPPTTRPGRQRSGTITWTDAKGVIHRTGSPSQASADKAIREIEAKGGSVIGLAGFGFAEPVTALGVPQRIVTSETKKVVGQLFTPKRIEIKLEDLPSGIREQAKRAIWFKTLLTARIGLTVRERKQLERFEKQKKEQERLEREREEIRRRITAGTPIEKLAELGKFVSSVFIKPESFLRVTGQALFGGPEKGERILDILTQREFEFKGKPPQELFVKSFVEPGGFGQLGVIGAGFVGAFKVVAAAGTTAVGTITGTVLTGFAKTAPLIAGTTISGLVGAEVGLTLGLEKRGELPPGTGAEIAFTRLGQFAFIGGFGALAAGPPIKFFQKEITLFKETGVVTQQRFIRFLGKRIDIPGIKQAQILQPKIIKQPTFLKAPVKPGDVPFVLRSQAIQRQQFQNLERVISKTGIEFLKPKVPSKAITPIKGEPRIAVDQFPNLERIISKAGIEFFRPKVPSKIITPSIDKFKPIAQFPKLKRIITPEGIEVFRPIKKVEVITPIMGEPRIAVGQFPNLERIISKAGIEFFRPRVPTKVITPSIGIVTRTGIIKAADVPGFITALSTVVFPKPVLFEPRLPFFAFLETGVPIGVTKPIVKFKADIPIQPKIKIKPFFKGVKDMPFIKELRKVSGEQIQKGGLKTIQIQKTQQKTISKQISKLVTKQKQVVKTTTKLKGITKKKISIEELARLGRFDIDEFIIAGIFPGIPKAPIIIQKQITKQIQKQIQAPFQEIITVPKLDVIPVVEPTFEQIQIPGQVLIPPEQITIQEQIQLQEQAQAQIQKQIQKQITEQQKGGLLLPTGAPLGFAEIEEGPGFNVLVKEKFIEKGRKVRPERFSKVATPPISKNDALDLGSFLIDNSAARSFKVVKTDQKARPINLDITRGIGFKFRKKGNILIERVQYAIDSQGEHEQITALGLLAQLKREKRVTRPRTRREREIIEEPFGAIDFTTEAPQFRDPFKDMQKQLRRMGFGF